MTVTAFIDSCRAEHDIPVRTSCRALGVSESWYYKHRDRPPTARASRRRQLIAAVREAFEGSGGTYGSPRVTLELRAAGWVVSTNTVAALMREQGLVARVVRRRRSLTRQGRRPAASDLLERRFTADAPNTVWVGDVTMIRTAGGPLYLATVLDLFSRRLLGYAMSGHHDAALTVASLQMAAATRGGRVDGVIFHSDSETVGAGAPGVPDSHSDGHTPGCWCRALPGFLTRTPIDEVLSFLGSVGALGAPGEALRLAVGVT